MTVTGDNSGIGHDEIDPAGEDLEPEADGGELGEDTETDEGADLVAELDDDPDPAFEAGPEDDEEPLPVYAGTCHDGPWDGRQIQVRFPKGFLLVDKPNAQVWIYDRHEGGDFYARTPDPRALLEDGPYNRWRAAEEPNYDLLVVDAALDDQDDDEDEGGFDDGSFDAGGGY
jgi:hypothetical protein